MIDFGKVKDENDYLMPHFIFCFKEYHYREDLFTRNWREFLLTKMRKHGIPSSMFTILNMWRGNLVTKEKVKAAYNQKLKNDRDWKGQNESFHDDLESFLFNIQNHNPIKQGEVRSFFTPKLTDDELKLVESKNEEYFKTFYNYNRTPLFQNPDVSIDEMKKSDSKDKFVHCYCLRQTFTIYDFFMDDSDCLELNKIASRKRNWSDL